MRLACIDIGSNTTRLLVADVSRGVVAPVAEQRAFISLGHALELDGSLPAAELDEVVRVARAQLARARELEAQEVHVVATAAVRRAENGGELVERLLAAMELPVRVLSPAEEAHLAFLGAAGQLPPQLRVAVVDIGGGSCELAVGSPPGDVRWSTSLAVGSATLTARHLTDDPPGRAQIESAAAALAELLAAVRVPPVDELVAVGGSATSLRRLGGATLEASAIAGLLREATACPSRELAQRAALEPQRARLLPAGLTILAAVAGKFGRPLRIGAGGVREGVLIEAAG